MAASAPLLTKVSTTATGLQSTAARPTRFRFFVDDSCENVAEVLVHSWLKLLGLPAKVCHLAELLLAKSSYAGVPMRMQEELASISPIQIVEVGCLSCFAWLEMLSHLRL